MKSKITKNNLTLTINTLYENLLTHNPDFKKFVLEHENLTTEEIEKKYFSDETVLQYIISNI